MGIEKECFKCHEVKLLTEFYRHAKMADGHLNKCKTCTKTEANKHRDDNLERIQQADRDRYAADPETKKKRSREYYDANKDACNKKSAEWVKNNPDKRKIICKKNRDNHPGYMAQYERERKAIDPAFAMMRRLRVRLQHALRAANGKKAHRTLELIGCTPQELLRHLEAQFVDGMTWENRSLWHIDHKRSCSSYDLTIPDQQSECFHFSNLQPLWGEDNLRKGAK